MNIPTDVASWFTSIPALAAVVASLVALLRKHFLKTLDGKLVIVLSAVLGIALAYFGKLLGFLSSDWFYFGLMAGLTASGGVDLLRGFVGAPKDTGKPSGAAKRRFS